MNIFNLFNKKKLSFEKKIIINWTGYTNMSSPNIKFTKNVNLYDLTRTDKLQLIDENRTVNEQEIKTLEKLAFKMEQVIEILGNIDIHSGRRCKKLNDSIGSTDKSQHLLCEACDFSPAGPDTETSVREAFNKIVDAAKQRKIKFGQLIIENAKRDYGRSYWIHISLGAPWRDPLKCGQVLAMKDGKYTLQEVIKWEA